MGLLLVHTIICGINDRNAPFRVNVELLLFIINPSVRARQNISRFVIVDRQQPPGHVGSVVGSLAAKWARKRNIHKEALVTANHALRRCASVNYLMGKLMDARATVLLLAFAKNGVIPNWD